MTKMTTTTKFRPAGYRLLVKPHEVEKMSEGGIVIPDNQLERHGQTRGTILAVGSCAWTDHGDGTAWAEVGDDIIYLRHAGMKIFESSYGEGRFDDYVLINDSDVVAVID